MPIAAAEQAARAPQPDSSIAGYFRHHGAWAPGVRLFRRLDLGAKAAVLCAVLVLPLLALLAWKSWGEHHAAIDGRLQATRQHVEAARGVIAWAHAHESRGEWTREQAQKMALGALRALAAARHGDGDHFWVTDMQPRMVMHAAAPELDGQDLREVKDAHGNPLFRSFAELARTRGGGPSAYLWSRPGEAEPARRVAYVAAFEPWGWTLGSASDVDGTERALWHMHALTAGAVGLALLVGFYLFRSFYLVLKGGLREVSAHLKALTDGDLTSTPRPWGTDEAAGLMNDLSVMQASLKRIVAQVRDSSQNLTTASDEIASASMDLSGRTEQAAANLEQGSASLVEITATVQRAAESTVQAAALAAKNAAIAAQGSEVILEAESSMARIKASSDRITDIIGVIDGIAFQTNILALNAAIEAARAGAQGRGFAVVASEVRSLAARSSAAAKEVRSLITSSVEQSLGGTRVVQDAGGIMRQIVGSAQTMHSLLSDIAAASADNSTGLDRVRQSIVELDRMTQQNAALVEETAASAGAMKARAADLAAAASAFKLTSDANGMRRKKLSHELTASPQISVAELARLKSEGFRSIICNRPDREGPGQTRFADVERSAREVGLQARHLPIEPGKATARDAEAFAALMRELPKPILAYCRTGMRSANLWKLSHPAETPLEP